MTDPSPPIRFVGVSALGRAPGGSHLAEVRGGRTVYLSGRIAVDERGGVVGAGDFAAQARRVFGNIRLALAEVELTFGAVVKLTVFLTDLTHLPQFRAVRDEFVNVAAPLVCSEPLIEAEAIAVAPQACMLAPTAGGDWR